VGFADRRPSRRLGEKGCIRPRGGHPRSVRHPLGTWWGVLALLASVRVAISLLAFATWGTDLELWPEYDGEPLHGDAFGFYSATREFLASIVRVPPPLFALAVLLVAGSIAAVVRARGGRRRRSWLFVVLPAFAIAFALTLVIREMESSAAAVMGWPLVWAVSMIPYRAAGLEPTPDVAFVFGFGLSLAALVATTVATAYVGRLATGARSVGLGAAGLFAIWPLVVSLVVGREAWTNDQWNVDVGLHLYTEPHSTALVTVGVALLLRSGLGTSALAGSGLALGYATFVKLTNGLVALALLPILVAKIGWRRTVPFAVGGIVSLPLVVAYWPLGDVGVFESGTSVSERLWALDYVDDTWGRSTLFTPVLLALLAPFLLAGILALQDRFALAVLLTPVVVTTGVYSFFDFTYQHPRYLYVALPFVFVLEAAGVRAVLRALLGLVKGPFGGGRSGHPAR